MQKTSLCGLHQQTFFKNDPLQHIDEVNRANQVEFCYEEKLPHLLM